MLAIGIDIAFRNHNIPKFADQPLPLLNMKFSTLSAAFLAAATLLGAANVSASTMTYDRRAITNTTFTTTHDYQAGWSQQTSTINSTALTSFNGQAPGNSSFSHLILNFNVGPASNLIFQFGLDAGYGAEVRVDGNLAIRNSNNLWWNNNFANVSGLLATPVFALGTGHHVIDGFWAEDCCGGSQAGRFSTDNGASWKNLDIASLNTLASVPEPGMLALFGIGLAGIGFKRRKRAN